MRFVAAKASNLDAKRETGSVAGRADALKWEEKRCPFAIDGIVRVPHRARAASAVGRIRPENGIGSGVIEEDLCRRLGRGVLGCVKEASLQMNVNRPAHVPPRIDGLEGDLAARVGDLVAAQEVSSPGVSVAEVSDV